MVQKIKIKLLKKNALKINPRKKTWRKKDKSAARSAAEAKRKAEEEKIEKLRQKVIEQKRIRDQRKEERREELAKKQKEIDDETLKALKLTAQPPTKIPKIPKKGLSFADMIAIPGANAKDKEPKKVVTQTKTKEKEKEVTNLKEKEAKPAEPVNEQRKSRPKVFSSSKSRSLGLLEEMEQAQPKNKAKLKEEKEKEADADFLPPGSLKKAKRPSIDAAESATPKKAKVDKKEPAGKKIVGIQESTLFMDTLNSVTTRTTRSAKRRSSELKDTPPTPPIVTPPPKSPGEEQKPVVFNFYRDTLADSEEKAEDDNEKSTSSNENEGDEEVDIPMDSFVPAVGEGLLKSALVIHRSRSKSKKTVRWVEEDELKKFHYFEMDETERVNVTKTVRNFTEMKQIERSEERKVLKQNLRKDNMEEKTVWVKPAKIIFSKPPHETGTYSQEAIIQEERETQIMEVLYFFKTQIPDSPGEPDEPLLKNQDDPSILKYEINFYILL